MTDIRELLAAGVLEVYIYCEDCYLESTCKNKCIGCCNFNQYKCEDVKKE
jgi:hypothetical protein